VAGSSFSWLDHSEAQRHEVLELLDRFRERGTLDELGFGSIRDAFSDRFFPGISTIQTRARYLLFVPWIYRRIEQTGVPYAQVDVRARQDQAILAQALQKGGERENQGVIGILAGEALQRTPAAIYWTGLRWFRIWQYPGSMAQYYAVMGRIGPAARAVRSDDGELVERVAVRGWHAELPDEPAGMFNSCTLTLTREEAEYLCERIASEVPGSLLSLSLRGNRRIGNIRFPWEHPDFADFSNQLKGELRQGRRFAIASYAAALLYNLMLAETSSQLGLPVPGGLVDQRRKELEDTLGDRESLRAWQLCDLWSTVVDNSHRISYPTRQFVEGIVGIMQQAPRAFADHQGARELIERRERSLKGALARLSNRRALEKFTGSAGLYEQTYRWPNARRIVGDIQAGLAQSHSADGDSDA
jgi:hypothetical protein